MFKIMLVCSNIMFNSLTALKITNFNILCNPLLSKNWSVVWEIFMCKHFLAAHFQFKLPLFV